MEFNEKLQALRRSKGLTQEELAQVLYVSRAAVSKWESGRGYPGIDSLKAIARFFSVTIDELLSGDEMLSLAEEDGRHKEKRVIRRVFGLFDCCHAAFLFMPVFRQAYEETFRSVSLLVLNGEENGLKPICLIYVILMVVYGILMLTVKEENRGIEKYIQNRTSFVLNALGVVLFIASLHPYATALSFIFLMMKAMLMLKKR